VSTSFRKVSKFEISQKLCQVEAALIICQQTNLIMRLVSQMFLEHICDQNSFQRGGRKEDDEVIPVLNEAYTMYTEELVKVNGRMRDTR
jgi:hypothetical protein